MLALTLQDIHETVPLGRAGEITELQYRNEVWQGRWRRDPQEKEGRVVLTKVRAFFDRVFFPLISEKVSCLLYFLHMFKEELFWRGASDFSCCFFQEPQVEFSTHLIARVYKLWKNLERVVWIMAIILTQPLIVKNKASLILLEACVNHEAEIERKSFFLCFLWKLL